MNTEKLKEYIKSKCFEVLGARGIYLQARKEFFTTADPNRCNADLCSSSVMYYAKNMREAYLVYNERRFLVRQFVHVLGDEYMEIYNSIIEDDDNDANTEDDGK